MLKLLLCSAVAAPCFVMPFIGSANEKISEYEMASFEDAYFEPELEKIKSCESAELDVFFSHGYIETHTADYLNESLRASSTCGNIRYIIQPMQSDTPNQAELTGLQAELAELSSFLDVHDISADIAPTAILQEDDTFLINGRSAILRIVVADEDSV